MGRYAEVEWQDGLGQGVALIPLRIPPEGLTSFLRYYKLKGPLFIFIFDGPYCYSCTRQSIRLTHINPSLGRRHAWHCIRPEGVLGSGGTCTTTGNATMAPSMQAAPSPWAPSGFSTSGSTQTTSGTGKGGGWIWKVCFIRHLYKITYFRPYLFVHVHSTIHVLQLVR